MLPPPTEQGRCRRYADDDVKRSWAALHEYRYVVTGLEAACRALELRQRGDRMAVELSHEVAGPDLGIRCATSGPHGDDHDAGLRRQRVDEQPELLRGGHALPIRHRLIGDRHDERLLAPLTPEPHLDRLPGHGASQMTIEIGRRPKAA